MLIWNLRSVGGRREDLRRAHPEHRWEYLSGYLSFGRLADRVDGSLGPAAQAELGEDARHVVLGGAAADHQPLGDVGVRQPVGEEREDLGLALGQRPVALGPGATARAEFPQERRRGI